MLGEHVRTLLDGESRKQVIAFRWLFLVRSLYFSSTHLILPFFAVADPSDRPSTPDFGRRTLKRCLRSLRLIRNPLATRVHTTSDSHRVHV